jgi:hypothetical protein
MRPEKKQVQLEEDENYRRDPTGYKQQPNGVWFT